MADIRTSGVIDPTDSRSVPESPLSYGGRWAVYFQDGSDTLSLYDIDGVHHSITLTDQSPANPQQAHYRWTPQTFTGDCEIWGHISALLGWDDGASLSLGFTDANGSSWNGWHGRANNTFSFNGFEIWKITGGSGTKVAQTSGGYGVPSHEDLMLVRRAGSQIQIWSSSDGGANWTNDLNYTDSAYQTSMYLSVGSSVASVTDYPGLYHIGGGQAKHRAQIYRYVSN